MLIKGDLSYCEGLTELWHNVFGDDYDYIDYFFEKAYPYCDTFITLSDGKPASAFYLLPCYIDYEGKRYKGKYLYAAATLPEYRGKGLMAELINEAIFYCRNSSETDFISLVPADEGLYGYYGRFGFKTAMYRYETGISDSFYCSGYISEKIENSSEFYNLRDKLSVNKFIFDECLSDYVFSSMINEGCTFGKIHGGGYFICDGETVYEFISFDGENISHSCFKGRTEAYSPSDLSFCGESRAVPFGMIYPCCNELTREWNFTDIYMNLALN